jgi:hypothetical protein
MKIKIAYLAWLLFPTAIAVWAAVGLFVWTIASDEADRAFDVRIVQESETKAASAIRLRAIAQDTVAERAKLESFFHADIVSIVNMIEAVGKAAEVKVTVSNVIPENVPSQVAGNAKIVATGFVIEADGRFSALMHVLRLFETLPIPSVLGRLDMEHNPSAAGSGSSDTWHMNVYIRVLSTSDASS